MTWTVERLIEALRTYPLDIEVRVCIVEDDAGIGHLEDGVTDDDAPCVVIMSEEVEA